jgi:hypothetical protein
VSSTVQMTSSVTQPRPPLDVFAWRVGRQPVLPLTLALLAFGLRMAVGPLTIDDAYITFRYARNIAEGAGFVYNAGEHVLGTTTPLYALLLAGLYRLGLSDLPQVAATINALSDSVTTLLLYSLGLRLGLGRGLAALLATLFAVAPTSVAYAASGMESSWFVLLIIAALSADCHKRPTLAASLAGLATLTRPEGLLVGGLILSRHLLDRRLPPTRAVAAFVLLLLPWLLFSTWWFGDPVPQSVAAKAVHYRYPPFTALATMLVGPLFSPDFLGLTATLSALPAVGKARQYWQSRPQTMALTAFVPLYLLAYGAAGAVTGLYVFPWYTVPMVPFYLLAVVAGIKASGVEGRHLLAGAIAVAVVFITLAAFPSRLDSLLSRECAFAAAARDLAPRLTRETVVALPEIGAFGYLAPSRVLDTAGLVSPEALPFYPLPADFPNNIAVPPGLIAAMRPDFIVSHEALLTPHLTDADWFRADYRKTAEYEAPTWGKRYVVVYERERSR